MVLAQENLPAHAWLRLAGSSIHQGGQRFLKWTGTEWIWEGPVWAVGVSQKADAGTPWFPWLSGFQSLREDRRERKRAERTGRG